MSKEHDRYGLEDGFRMIAVAFLGFITTFFPESSPGMWAEKKKRKMRTKH